MKNIKERVSIIIPTHNEEKRIKRTLVRYGDYFTLNNEILVILDNCQDRTLQIVKSLTNKYPYLRYKDIPYPVGKGGALIEGFKLVKGGIIAYIDADGSTSPEELDRLIKNMREADGVIGSRWSSGAVICKKQPLIRKIASRIFNLLVRALFLFPYRDTQCGAKVFRREVIEQIVDQLGTTNFAFDVDLLYRLHKKNYWIKELPTVWADQSGSTLDLKKVAPIMLIAVIELRLKNSFLKIFFRE